MNGFNGPMARDEHMRGGGYRARQWEAEELELGSLRLVQEAETRVRICPAGSVFRV